jgi:hypothetical protein
VKSRQEGQRGEKAKSQFVLWFSVFVRDVKSGTDTAKLGNVARPSLDIMLETLKSYSKLPFDKVYLNILLDDSLKNRKGEIDELIESSFDCPVDYVENRDTLRDSLIERFNEVKVGMNDNDFVFFTQNDDHPFIDFNNDIVMEGLEHMRNDPHPYKSLYFSHWPEIIKLAMKQNKDEQIGNFIKFNALLPDALQIFNVGFLDRVLRLIPDFIRNNSNPNIVSHCGDTAANGHRIDCAVLGHEICDGKEGVTARVYVPLRELCVHFDAYQHVQIPLSIYPRLHLPFEKNNFDFSPEQRVERMTVTHNGWNVSNMGGENAYQDPLRPVHQKYIDTMLKCYG